MGKLGGGGGVEGWKLEVTGLGGLGGLGAGGGWEAGWRAKVTKEMC